MPYPEEPLLLPSKRPVPELSAVRSTLLLGSIECARSEGLFDAYVERLPPDAREVLLEAVAGVWLPVSVARAHYEALDALSLSPQKQVELGRRVFDRIEGTLLGTAVRGAAGAGVSLWSILPNLDRFWARGLYGSALAVYRTGPKDARVDVLGLPLLRIPYFRNALRGLAMGLFSLFCARFVVAEARDGMASMSERSYRLQWA